MILETISTKFSDPGISKMWSAFSVLSILSEIFRILFRFQSLKCLDNIESTTKSRPHVGNAKTID